MRWRKRQMIELTVLWRVLQDIFPSPPPGESYLGWVVFAIFIAPPIILLASSALGKPRSGGVVLILTGTLAAGLIGFVVVTYILSFVLHALFFA